VDSALDTARRISTELRPGILDLGIVAAIEWQSSQFQQRMDVPCRVACVQEEIPLEDEIAIALFRIFQETLTNIAKHACASQVEVELGTGDGRVSLVVSDNGIGITDSDLSRPNAFGIRGMKERMLHLGGDASISRASAGTTVTVSVPISRASPQASTSDDVQLPLFGRAFQSMIPEEWRNER